MLSERICQLLTAYVDGELSARKRKAIEHLLSHSAEAQALVQKLQQAADVLHRMPRRTVGHDLSVVVLRRIAEKRLHPARRGSLSGPPMIPAWLGLGSAAAVLLVIAAASYFYFSASLRSQRATPAAVAGQKNPAPFHPNEPGARKPEVIVKAVPDHPAAAKAKPADQPAAGAKTSGAGPKGSGPTPKPKPPANDPNADPSALTELTSPKSPDPKMEVFDKVDMRLALTLPLRALNQKKSRERLRQAMVGAGALRVELSCLGNGKAFEHLQAAWQGQGGRLLIDRLAQVRLQLHMVKTDFILYCDCLSAAELAKMLERLSVLDEHAGAGHKGVRQFDVLLVNPLSKTDHAKLAELLGVDPTVPQPVKLKAPLGVDVRKPLAQSTADELARALAGQGSARPAPGQAAVKPASERLGIVLAYNPVRRKPALSREVMMFLAQRQPPRPGSIRLLLILRGVNG